MATQPQRAGHSARQTMAAVEARTKAQRTPKVVRDAMIHSGPRTVGGITLQPFSLGHIWLLEDIDSPFIADGEKRVTTKDLALAIFIFAYPDQAAELVDSGGVAELTPPARAMAAKIPPTDLIALGKTIGELIQSNLKPAPGGDGSNPTAPRTTTGG